MMFIHGKSLLSLSSSKDVATQKPGHVSFTLEKDDEIIASEDDNHGESALSTSKIFSNSQGELLDHEKSISSAVAKIRHLLKDLKDMEETKNLGICSHCSKGYKIICKNCQRCAQIARNFLATKVKQGGPDWLTQAKTLISGAIYAHYSHIKYVKDISDTQLMHILKELQKVINEENLLSHGKIEKISLERRLLERIFDLVDTEESIPKDDETLGEEFTKEKLLENFGTGLCEEIIDLLLMNLKLTKEDLEEVLGVDLVTYMIDSVLGNTGRLNKEKCDRVFGNRLSNQFIDRALSYYQGIVEFKDEIVELVSRYVSKIAMPQIMSDLQNNDLRKQALEAVVPLNIVNNIINGALKYIGILTRYKLERLAGQTLGAELENKLLTGIAPLTREKSEKIFGLAKAFHIEDKLLTYAGENYSIDKIKTILGRNQVKKLQTEVLRNLKTKRITKSNLVKLLGQDFDKVLLENVKDVIGSQKTNIKLHSVKSSSPKINVYEKSLPLKRDTLEKKTRVTPKQNTVYPEKVVSSMKTVCNLKMERRKGGHNSSQYVKSKPGKENKLDSLKVSHQTSKEDAGLAAITPNVDHTFYDTKKSLDDPDIIMSHRQRKSTHHLLNKIRHSEKAVGIIRYQLSDPKFIHNGWTQLPTMEKFWRIDTYKTEQASPERDWFKRHKDKRIIFYNSGEKLAVIDSNGYGRWYYINGNLALDYYKAKEPLIGSRYVVYSSGQQSDFGTATEPITVLASFDLLGHGTVFDEHGNERLKYNQREGIVFNKLTRTRWHWHNLAQVKPEIVFTEQYDPIDQSVLKQLGIRQDTKTLEDEEEQQMLEIEHKVQARENMRKIKKFKIYDIQPQSVKINKQFSLNILSQKIIYLKFKDENGIVLKHNVGVVLIPEDVIHSEIKPNNEITTSFSVEDPESQSIKDLKYVLKMTKARHEKKKNIYK